MDDGLHDLYGKKPRTPPWVFLERIREDSSFDNINAVFKEAIEEKNWVFLEGVRRALLPFPRDFIVNLEEKTPGRAYGFPWHKFLKLHDNLITRADSYSERREQVKMAYEDSNATVWNKWYRPILLKRLGIRMSYKIFNRVMKKNMQYHRLIELFYPQRTNEFRTLKNTLKGERLIDYWPDGPRCTVLADPEGEAICYARNGTTTTLWANTIAEYTNFAKNFLNEPAVFDGYILSEEHHNFKKLNYGTKNMRIQDGIHLVMDVLPWREYRKRIFKQPLLTRRNILEKTIKHAHKLGFLTNTQLLQYIMLDLDIDSGKNMDALYARLDEAIEWGHVGLVIKKPDKPYKCNRSRDWISLKPRESLVLKMNKFVKHPERDELFRIECSTTYEGKQVLVNLGRGFTNDEKKEFWKERDELLGGFVEVTFTAMHEGKSRKTGLSLECPMFYKMRPDLNDGVTYDNEHETQEAEYTVFDTEEVKPEEEMPTLNYTSGLFGL